LLRNETTKLFYNEYAYRLSMRTIVAPIFRDRTLNYARQRLDTWREAAKRNEKPMLYRYHSHTTVPRDEIYFGLKLLRELQRAPAKYSYRVEADSFNMFTNNKQWLVDLQNRFSKHVVEFSEPKNVKVLESDTEITKIKGYDYKVTLKWTGKTYKEFGEWCQHNKQLIRLTPSLKKSLNIPDTDITGRYFYVKNSNTLMLVNLFVSDAIRSVKRLIHENDVLNN
jgi:hypothetical protein